jgi:hypothetical protein
MMPALGKDHRGVHILDQSDGVRYGQCRALTRPDSTRADDTELWLRLAAGVAAPQGTDDWGRPGEGDGEPRETDAPSPPSARSTITTGWAVITALAVGRSGTSASATDLAAYVRDYDPDDGESAEEGDLDSDDPDFELDDLEPDLDPDEDGEFDEIGMEDLFVPVTALWQVLGAIDEDERLTPLGWWGLAEAMRIVWAPYGETAELTLGRLLLFLPKTDTVALQCGQCNGHPAAVPAVRHDLGRFFSIKYALFSQQFGVIRHIDRKFPASAYPDAVLLQEWPPMGIHKGSCQLVVGLEVRIGAVGSRGIATLAAVRRRISREIPGGGQREDIGMLQDKVLPA